LTLFGENKPGAENLSYGKRSRIIDHAKVHGLEGLITLIGVRFTTAGGVGKKAVDLAFGKLGKTAPKSTTTEAPIYGGQIENIGEYLNQAIQQRHPALSAEAMPALIYNYGSGYQDVVKYIEKNQKWADTIGTSTVTKAEVVHAVREEMAHKLGDVVLRRTDLGTGGHPGEAALQSCAAIMATELNWSQQRVQDELTEVRSRFPKF